MASLLAASQSSTKLAPIKPAPPVTRRVMGNEKNRVQRALHHLDWILEALKLRSPRAFNAFVFRHAQVKVVVTLRK